MNHLESTKMFTSIKTSEANKEVVTKLTRSLNLGSENIIARLALTYSLSQEKQLDLKFIMDSKGKEYSKGVLFGDHYKIYAGMIVLRYGLSINDKNLPKYLKMHIDDGLNKLNLIEPSYNSLNDLICWNV